MHLAGINSIKLKQLVDKSFKKDLFSKNNVNNIFMTAVSQIIIKKKSISVICVNLIIVIKKKLISGIIN
jgi:hypothetical protein